MAIQPWVGPCGHINQRKLQKEVVSAFLTHRYIGDSLTVHGAIETENPSDTLKNVFKEKCNFSTPF